ncbi:MAG: ABC transporter ATP-binding protein [Clostridia bacterium]|nr:ABC transporter ATP-binding protein [Clostridia bacterium]
MYQYYPLIVIGAIIGVISVIFIVAFCLMKDKKSSIGFDRSMKDADIIKRLLAYAKPHIKSFAVVILVMLFSIAYDIISPILIGNITEMLKGSFELAELYSSVAIYASILIVSLISSYVQAILLQRTGQKIVSAMRVDLFEHIESLSHQQLSSMPVGRLVTRVVNDTDSISHMFTGILVNLFKNIFIVFGILGAMLCLNYMLTLMVLCFVPFVILFTIIFRKFSRKAYRQVNNATTAINTYLSENLSGMKIIQIFNREERKQAEFDERNTALGKSKRAQMFTFGIFRPMVYMLYIASVLCLFYLGARGYINDLSFLGQTVSAGTIVTFYMYLNKFFNPIQALAEQFNLLQHAFASAEKIFTVFDISPTVVDCEDAIELDEVKGDIEFRDVWFCYNPDEWVLKGVSFKVNANETVAFVGATGSGKTTILSLICRNYDIQRGQILIDGIDIKKIKISSLRSHFGQMLQDVFLFAGTIKSNIVLHNEDISDEEIETACDYVNASHFIKKLERGIYTEVRERGNNFSQGQRQLLSFARTIIHKPSVMILDEATANIDTETEVLIQESLERIMSIGTMLMVAHRLSTIQHADRIIVLSHGEIVESGSHAQLLENRGRYYDLYMLQYNKDLLTNKP